MTLLPKSNKIRLSKKLIVILKIGGEEKMLEAKETQYVRHFKWLIIQAKNFEECLSIIQTIQQKPFSPRLLRKAFLKTHWFVQTRKEALRLLQEAILLEDEKLIDEANQKANLFEDKNETKLAQPAKKLSSREES